MPIAAPRHWPSHLRAAVLAGAGLLIVAGLAEAHDTWLIPDLLAVATGNALTIRAQAGGERFPAGSPVPQERVREALVTSASSSVVLRHVEVADGALRLRYTPPAPGQYAISLALTPRSTRTTAPALLSFLEREGARPEAERLATTGVLGGATDSLTYVHQVFAMTYVDVGSGGPGLRPGQLHLPLEFSLLDDPGRLRVGDTLRVQVFAEGRALPTHAVEVHPGEQSASTSASRPVAEASTTEPKHYVRFMTDGEGVARIPLVRAGPWLLRGAYVRPSSGGEARTFEVTRATVVWRVGES